MKKVAVSLGVLALLGLGTYGLGVALPQDHRAVVSKELDAAQGIVWRAIADVEAYPRWRRGLDGVEVLPPGARGNGWTEVSGSERLALVVLEEEPLRRRVVRILDEGLPFGGTWETELTPTATGTRVTVTEEGSVYAPLYRVISRFVMGHERTARRWLEDLDAYLQNDPAGVRSASTEYEPDLVHPFGRLNPQAPPEVAQFSFMVGRFQSTEERRRPDGSYERRTAIWEAKYILNGQAIQDTYWRSGMAATSIRFFDTERGRWLVNYQAKPGNLFGFVWEGGMDGDHMVLTATYPNADGDTILSRLTYHDITSDGFRWTSEETNRRTGEHVVDWRITARRINGA